MPPFAWVFRDFPACRVQWYIRNACKEMPVYPSTDGGTPGYVLSASLSKRMGRLAHTAEIFALKNVVIFRRNLSRRYGRGAPIKF